MNWGLLSAVHCSDHVCSGKGFNQVGSLVQARRKVLETRLWQMFWFVQAETRRAEVYQVIFGHSLSINASYLIHYKLFCISSVVSSVPSYCITHICTS